MGRGSQASSGNRPLVHVAFGESSAGSLVSAMRMMQRSDEVRYLGDDLAVGPIDPADPALRGAWHAEVLADPDDTRYVENDAALWQRLAAPGIEIVVWMSRRSATEYCGLLELLWRVTEAPVSIIDVADMELVGADGVPRPDISRAFARVADTRIVELKLVERAAPVAPSLRDAYRAEWQALRSENAPLRVLSAAGLASAPITYFDELLSTCAPTSWRVCARVIEEALVRAEVDGFRQGGGDVLLCERLLALIDAGVLEGQDDEEEWSLYTSFVRRPSAPT